MLVAICDDDAVFRKQLKSFLIDYNKSCRVPIDVVEFSSGDALVSSKERYDIVFMDYEMPGINGLEAAHKLRANKHLCCIIFLTSYPEHVFDSFQVGTYRYLLKPLDVEKATEALDDFIRDKKMMALVTVCIDGEMVSIPSEDIVYLEAEGKFCNIRTDKQFVRSSRCIAKIYALLPQHCFYRTHKSYVVNFYAISKVKENTIFLLNGEQVSISRRNLTGFKNAYREFVKHFVVKI